MADISKLSSLSSDYYASSSSTANKNDIGKDAFLNLLVTQMKYQDPINPTDDKEFMSQMAQFTSLEQLQNLNKAQDESKAYNLVGKYIMSSEYNGMTGATSVTEGRVEGVIMKSGEAYVVVGEKQIKVSDIDEVYEDYTELQRFLNLENALNVTQNISLIGKNVEYNTYDANGKVAGTYTGKVDYVKFKDGLSILSINGKEVYGAQVSRIFDGEIPADAIDTTTDTETDTEIDGITDGDTTLTDEE